MSELDVLITFAGGLTGALVFGYAANRLKLSPIVGYLLAGIVVGPFTPGFIASHEVADQFAKIGVILLLFGIGLRFHLKEMLAVWKIAVPGALIQSFLSTVVMALLLHLIGWSWVSGIVLGMAISVASTVVMSLVLGEWHDLHAPIGYIAVGWTVVEDILTVAMLLLLPILFGATGGAGVGIGTVLGVAALKIMGLVAVVIVLGRWGIPWALDLVEKTRSRELFTLAVLVLAVGIAVGSARIFGVSMELGAFLAGLAVGRSEFAARAAGDAVPMRDAFAVLFFVSVGMLFDPNSIVETPLLIVAVLAVVIVGKPLAALLTVRSLGIPLSTAIPVGASFSQVGEFSFILGTVALNLELIDKTGWNALIAASIISIALNPSVYRWARRLSTRTRKQNPIISGQRSTINPNQCILVGYGPIGEIVHRLLIERGAEITVIDINLTTIRKLKAAGFKTVYGDVLKPGTLDEAGIATAGCLILSADIDDAPEIIRQVRFTNPDIRILVRCSNLREAPALRDAGATVIAAGEAEVGVALAEAVTADDAMDTEAVTQQRETIRRKLYGSLET